MTDRRMDFLEQSFTHVPGDVWVITYQKVGTTWTQYIVSLLMGHPAVGSWFDLFDKCPWPEVDVGPFATTMDDLQRSAVNATALRCFKSHWPRQGFFAQLPESSKVIYVFRDAESVAVSYWHHILNIFGAYWVRPGDMTWDQYFEKWFAGDTQNGGYFEHVASWWEVLDRPNVLPLRYEDLRGDTRGSIRRIAEFIGVSLSDSREAEILEATSKPKMQAWNEGLVDKLMIRLGIMSGDHVRKDGAKKSVGFSEEQRSRAVERYEALLKPLGVPFEYMFTSGNNA